MAWLVYNEGELPDHGSSPGHAMSDSPNQESAARDRLLALLINVACPALIVCTVTSVAWFLIDILYVGPHEDRCKYIFGLFSFAAVFIGRISIQLGREKAAAYGFLLALIAFLVAARFMQGNIFVVGIMLVFVLWCASRLVWDCTFIDETRDASGQGLFDRLMTTLRNRGAPAATSESRSGSPEYDEWDSDETLFDYLLDKARTGIGAVLFSRRQANTPGTWAFIFLLAGLPFFGLGQIFISVWDEHRQSNVVVHAVVYFASLLGLLMLTSVYGMQRYLESKQSQLPISVARKWLLIGGGVALAIVIVAVFLPRPTPEYSLSRLASMLTSQGEDNANSTAGGDGKKQEDGARKTKSSDKAKQAVDGGDGRDKSQNTDASNPQSEQPDQDSSSDEERQGDASDSSNSDSKGTQSKSSSQKDQPKRSEGKSERGQPKRPDEPDSSQEQEKSDSENNRPPPQDAESTEAKKPAEAKRGRQNARADSSPEQNQNQQTDSSSWLGDWVTSLVRWVVLLVAAVAVIWVLFRHGKSFRGLLGSFLEELKRFWASLFRSRQKRESGETQPEPAATPRVRPRAFRDFANPFESGRWETAPPAELIRYTLDALEAWARDNGVSRSPDDTVLEFSRHLARAQPILQSELKGFTQLYNDVTYGGREPTNESIATIRLLWQRLDSHAPAQPQTANA